MLFNPEHPEKAVFESTVTLSGINMLSSAVQQQNAYVSRESVAGGNSAFTPLGEEGTTVLTAESPLAGDAQFAFEQSPDDEPTSVIENPFEK